MATLVTVIIFLPFQRQAWSIYAGACTGYTVLVFGLRRINATRANSPTERPKPASAMILTHLTFLAVVSGWVWFCMIVRPYLPYILTTEDTGRPYFGLTFFGILGLLGIEAVEQRWLRGDNDTSAFAAQDYSSQHKS